MLRSRIAISLLAYDVIWQAEGLQDKHLVLATTSPGHTDEERAVLEQQAWRELEGLGLAQRGRPHPDLVDTMHLLARPQQEFYGWISAPETKQRAPLVAASGQDAVLAEIQGDVLSLEPVRPTALAEALVRTLPDRAPARGQSFNLPADAFGEQPRGRHSRGAEEDNGGGFLQSSGGSSGGATPHRLRELMAKPRLAAGQLFTASRDRLGARRRSAAGLTFFDVAEGRYMAAKTPGPDGQDWVFVAPADPRAMAQKLTEMASGPTR